MEAKELRIGNLVFVGDLLGIINEKSFAASNEFDPIPLTEEWLLKFGFTKIGSIWTKWYNKYHPTKGYSLNLWESKEKTYFYMDIAPVKYVHQLQNLHFSLIGEELIP